MALTRPLLLFSFCFFICSAAIRSHDREPECGPGEVLIRKPEGSKCRPDRSYQWRNRGTTTRRPKKTKIYFGQDQRQNLLSDAILLPLEDDDISIREEECLKDEQIYWPESRRCYSLLQQGPCRRNFWLVLNQLSSTRVEIACRRRPCPCEADNPTLCEVLFDDDNCRGGKRCRVSLAAEQDGICPRGEQLLVSPFGEGICGCRVDPPHMRSPVDGRCHPLHSRGPCAANETLQFDPTSKKPLCVPRVCVEPGHALHSDGRCYEIGSRGPCDGDSIFNTDASNRDPRCKPRQNHVKRIFDLAPSRLRDDGLHRQSIIGNLRVQMSGDCAALGGEAAALCFSRHERFGSSSSKRAEEPQLLFSQRDINRRREQRRKAQYYLNFLWSFKK